MQTRPPRCRLLSLLLLLALVGCKAEAPGSGQGTGPHSEGGDSPDPDVCVPEEEICDDKDNDCDDLVDEGVRNPCGHCDESCYQSPVETWVDGESTEGAVFIAADDPGNPTTKPGLTLDKSTRALPYLWAANHEYDTVTKFNTETHTEEAVYWVGANPSRTAVDLDGNCWVGGRNDGRLTKILVDIASCPDRNGDGSIQTSKPDGGTVIQVNSASHPFADECVAYSEVPNASRPSIRGIAAAPNGRVWLGYSSGGIQSIDPHTFAVGSFHDGLAVPLWQTNANGVLEATGSETSAGGVYGLVVDSQGLLYVSSYDRDKLPCFNTNSEQWVAVYQRDGSCSYGIAVDARRRIWTGGWPNCGGVNMFDPAAMHFVTIAVPAAAVVTPNSTSGVELVANGGPGGNTTYASTGIAAEPQTGDIWTSFYSQGYTGRLRLSEADLSSSVWTFIATTRDDLNGFLFGVGADLRGVGFDQRGFAWTLGLGSDRVFKIDPDTNQRAATLPEGQAIGGGSHYTYSDFTGSTVLNFTAPRGYWRHEFTPPFACAYPEAIAWEAFYPPETTIGIRVRMLDLTGEAPYGWVPDPSVDGVTYFDLPTTENSGEVDFSAQADRLLGSTVEIEIRLSTTQVEVRPILHHLEVLWDTNPHDDQCAPM